MENHSEPLVSYHSFPLVVTYWSKIRVSSFSGDLRARFPPRGVSKMASSFPNLKFPAKHDNEKLTAVRASRMVFGRLILQERWSELRTVFDIRFLLSDEGLLVCECSIDRKCGTEPRFVFPRASLSLFSLQDKGFVPLKLYKCISEVSKQNGTLVDELKKIRRLGTVRRERQEREGNLLDPRIPIYRVRHRYAGRERMIKITKLDPRTETGNSYTPARR